MSDQQEGTERGDSGGLVAAIPTEPGSVWSWLICLFVWVSYSLMGMLVYYGAVGITHLYPSPPETTIGLAVGVLALLAGPIALVGHFVTTGILLFWSANAIARFGADSLEGATDV